MNVVGRGWAFASTNGKYIWMSLVPMASINAANSVVLVLAACKASAFCTMFVNVVSGPSAREAKYGIKGLDVNGIIWVNAQTMIASTMMNFQRSFLFMRERRRMARRLFLGFP